MERAEMRRRVSQYVFGECSTYLYIDRYRYGERLQEAVKTEGERKAFKDGVISGRMEEGQI